MSALIKSSCIKPLAACIARCDRRCIYSFSLYLIARLLLSFTWNIYTPPLPFTAWLETLPSCVAATAPLNAGSEEPVAATNTGAVNVIWSTVVTCAPLALACAIVFTPSSFLSNISAFLSLITSVLIYSFTSEFSSVR